MPPQAPQADPPPKDGCPAWASAAIAQICELEIRLGNINPGKDWQVSNVNELFHAAQDVRDDGASAFDASVVDSLFRQVSRGLTEAGFAAAQISTFINTRIPTGTRLPYCNAAEVEEALGDDA